MIVVITKGERERERDGEGEREKLRDVHQGRVRVSGVGAITER